MNKKLYDLTVEEFTRALLDYPEVHEIEITEKNGEKCTVRGTYEQLMSTVFDTGTIGERIKNICNNYFDYDISLDNITIYDYLDYKTKGFDKERVKIILYDMDYYYCMFMEEINTDLYNEYSENGKEIPTYTTEIQGKNMEFPNYDRMRNEAYPCWDFIYNEAVGLLKSKIKKDDVSINHNQNVLEVQKTKRKPGRPRGIFEDCIKYQDKEKFMSVIKPMMQGKKGVRIAEIIRACIIYGWLDGKVTFPMVEKAFGDVGNSSGYYNAMNSNQDSNRLQDIIRLIKAKLNA